MRQSLIEAGFDPDNLPPKPEMNMNREAREKKAWKHVWSAGQGVGSIADVPTVAALCARLKAEYAEAWASFRRGCRSRMRDTSEVAVLSSPAMPAREPREVDGSERYGRRLSRMSSPLRQRDSQSVKTTESGGPRGFDAAKRVKGRKRHIVTDTQGLLLALLVHAANIQDNHGAVPLLAALRQTFPKLQHIFADRVYRGHKLRNELAAFGRWTIEIVT